MALRISSIVSECIDIDDSSIHCIWRIDITSYRGIHAIVETLLTLRSALQALILPVVLVINKTILIVRAQVGRVCILCGIVIVARSERLIGNVVLRVVTDSSRLFKAGMAQNDQKEHDYQRQHCNGEIFRCKN